MSTEKLIYLPVGVLTAVTMVSGAVLGGAASYAEDSKSATATASVTIGDACSFTEGSDYTATLELSGNEATTAGKTDKPSMTVTCNDTQGFAVFAVGASDEVTVDGVVHTNYMKGTSDGTYIPTGTSGGSYWAMQVTSATNAMIQPGYNTWAEVPETNVAVVKANGSTTGSATSTIRTDYMVHVADGQAAGTYTGKVKYTLVHPSSAQPAD